MSELRITGRGGDVAMKWDASKPEEVETARKMFDDLRAKGYLAFRFTADQQRGEQITTFDPAAAEILVVPQIRGG